MEEFPDLKKNEVALLRAEKKTGIVLDEDLLYATRNDQKVYTIFASFREAKLFSENFLATNIDVEVAIYSSTQEVLYDSNPMSM